MVRVWDCRLQVATLAVQIFVMVSVVCTCVWRGSVMGKQHLMAFSWLGEHSAGKRSEFLVFLYNGRKFTRIKPFWSMKTVAMFFSSNRALLNCLSHSHDFSCWHCNPNFLKLTSCCRRSCTSLFITQGSPSRFAMLMAQQCTVLTAMQSS